MRRLRQYLAVALILTLLWGQLPPLPVWGQNTNVTLRLSPPALEVAAGQTVDVAVNIENVSGLYGFDITLAYDPAIVEVVDLDPNLDGIQLALGLFLDPGFVIFNQADNSLGQLRLVMTQLNPSEPKSGDGNLMVIRFQAEQAGETPLMLLDGQLAQPNGDTFFPELVDGQLTVTTTSLGQPVVFTPIPSQIAGTPLPTTTPELLPTLAATPAATATPTSQPAATTVDTPPATELPADSITVPPTTAATTTAPAGDPNAPESATGGSQPAATEVAPSITEAGTALVSDLNQVNDSPPVIVEATAVPQDETAGVSVIGSNNPAESSNNEQTIGPATNQPTGSWVAGASLGGGLLLVIVVLFFLLSRKRTGGAS